MIMIIILIKKNDLQTYQKKSEKPKQTFSDIYLKQIIKK